MHFAIIICNISPTSMGRNLLCLYRPIRRPTMSLRYADYGGRSFANHSTNSTTIFQSSPLASPKQIIQCCKLIDPVPPGLAPPEMHRVTYITVSSVKSIETSSGGRSGYASRLLDRVSWASKCFEQIMSRIGSLYLSMRHPVASPFPPPSL